MIVRFLIPALVALGAQAQEPADLFRKAPPEVDAALRARIAKFYQAHVDGKFRQAEAYVAEDTKDFYYTANKPKYLGFEIKNIEYSDNFTKAKVTMLVRQIIMIPGFSDRPLDIPIPSYWKIDHGDWCWYVDPEALRRTPFGVRPADADKSASSGAGGSLPSKIPQGPGAIQALWNQIKVDKNEIRLSPGGSAEVSLYNGLPGPITIQLDGTVPKGVEVKLPGEVKGGATARLSFVAGPDLPAQAATHQVALRVQPTNQPVTIRVITQAR